MIYTLEVIRQSEWLKANGSRDKVFHGSIITLSPWISRTGVVTTGIPENKRLELEKKLGYKEGTLAPNSPFLDTYIVKLLGGKLTIDTSTPNGELIYEFVSNHYLVAKDQLSILPKHEFVLRNEDAELVKINLKTQRKLDALNEVAKLTITQKRKCLRLIGQNSLTMTDELATARLTQYVENNPDDFFTKWVDNTDKEIEFLLESLVSMGVISKSRTNYKYGTDVIGTSKDDAIEYLKKKENSDLYSAINAEINAKLELKN